MDGLGLYAIDTHSKISKISAIASGIFQNSMQLLQKSFNPI